MSPRKTKIGLKHTLATILSVVVVALFVWWGMQFPGPALAQTSIGNPTPPPNCSVTPTPSPEALVALPTCVPCVTPAAYAPPYHLIPNEYQDPDHAKLAWVISTPTPAPASSPPGIVLIHGGSWYSGDATDIGYVAQDLAKAGYYVVSVNYELTRCGLIPGQICHEDDDPTPGSMVKRQTNNIKAFITALENDSHVDHTKIGVVGGSAGGGHAMSVALDTTQTPNNGHDWPYWFKDGNDTRPKCAVMLSGVYDFSDRTPPPGQSMISSDFILGTENYVNSSNFATLKANSPIALAVSANLPFPSIFMINSYFDTPPPYHQMVEMICAFDSLGFTDYQTHTIPNSSGHSFQYWNSPDSYPVTTSTPLIKADVIAFLDAHLK